MVFIPSVKFKGTQANKNYFSLLMLWQHKINIADANNLNTTGKTGDNFPACTINHD
jgi:hypothetical protein